MRYLGLSIMFAMLLSLSAARPAVAIVQFYNEFEKLYLKDHPNKEFVEEVRKGTNKCLVCHQGKNRKHHNAFGIHLVEPLDRKRDMRDKEKIAAEIKKAMALPVDPKQPEGETYADRLKAGQWPGGEYEELKKELPDDASE